MGTISVTNGPSAGTTVDIGDQLVIGREVGDLVIPDPEMSRSHTRVRAVDGGVIIEDLGSTNGTFVNEARITGPLRVTTNATIRTGGSEMTLDLLTPAVTRMRATIPAPAPAAPAAAAPVAAAAAAAAAPAAAAPAVAPTGSAPRTPPGGGGGGAGSSGRGSGSGGPSRLLAIGGAVAALVVVAVVVVLLVSGSSKKNHPVNITASAIIINQTGAKVLIVGTITGPPSGTGSLTDHEIFEGNPNSPTPVPINDHVHASFNDGSLSMVYNAMFATQPNGSVKVYGKGVFLGGTAEFKGATGTFDVDGGRPDGSHDAILHIVGNVKY